MKKNNSVAMIRSPFGKLMAVGFLSVIFVCASSAQTTWRDFFDRGQDRHRQQDLDGAIADYSKAIELDGSVATIYYYRALARKDKKDIDGAIEDYTKTLQINPKYVVAYFE